MDTIDYERVAADYGIPVSLCKLGFIYYPKIDTMTNEEKYEMMKRRRAFWHGYKKALKDLVGKDLLKSVSDTGLKDEMLD